MAISGAQVSVATTATLLLTAGNSERVLVRNEHATVDCYLGGSDVDATHGLTLKAATTLPVQLVVMSGESLYAAAATGTVTVSVLRSNK